MSEKASPARTLLGRPPAAGEEHGDGVAPVETSRDSAATIADFERALAQGLPPDARYRALLGLGVALRGAQRHQEAVHVFRVAAGEFPDMPALHAHMALAQHANGEARLALVTLLDLVLRYVPLDDQHGAIADLRELTAREPMADQGWRALAESLTRKEFSRTFTHPFLVEISGRMRAALIAEGLATEDDTKVNRRAKVAVDSGTEPTTPPPVEEPFVVPLRKMVSAVPSAITMGRSTSNDIVIPDAFVSKVHAFLRRGDNGWELADAGARNGAWIGGKRLDGAGAPTPLRSGDLLTFGRVVFMFLDAAALWDRLHQRAARV